MASDDPNQTDAKTASKNRPQRRSRLLLGCWLVFGVFLAGLLGWLVLANDPLGGEPVATVKLGEREDETAKVDTQGLGMRSTMRPEDKAKIAKAENDGDGDLALGIDPSGTEEAISPVSNALPPVPAKGLVEKTTLGMLPRISKDGRRPSQVYARKLDSDLSGSPGSGRIAILIGGMGLSAKGTQSAITRLPKEVTLGFAPYGRGLQAWIGKARNRGHEVLLQIPMEPYDFPDNDPGPYTLLTSLSAEENLGRLNWLMSRFVGYAGVTNYMGAKFTSSAEPMRSVFAEISRRGLIFIDNGTSQRSQTKEMGKEVGLGVSVADLVIDANPTESAIDNSLSRLEVIARRRGSAIGYATGLPITIHRIVEWSKSLEQKGLVLIPVTATVPAGQT